ncbi:type II secretion system protein [Thalassotalea sp. G2M2-11]|uniref:pilus assembly FimT family protein n=1 Tax=Thalassotalea sp. G2M2-11 TaxID=2787627 RepID=UPI0024084745|nr:type II secretion system protein [Thalassotalea sp. G2M2-11]
MILNAKYSLLKAQQGFTLIELVVTIMILVIMSVTVIPRFLSSGGFEEYGYRTEIISTLRAIQLRAMQQTDNVQCHRLKIAADGKTLGLMKTDASSNHCDETAWSDNNTSAGLTSVSVDSNHNITFSGDNFSFDQMGRPEGCATIPCIISINGGEQVLTITIEPEGYIHAS